MIAIPKQYVSHTQVEMYLRCPRQYEYRYIEGLIRPPAVALIEGSAMHYALETNNAQKITSHEDMPAKQVVECFADTFLTRANEIEDWEDQTADTVIERGKGMIDEYIGGVAKEIQPTAVEKEFRVDLDVDGNTVPVVGYIDIEQAETISDYKICAKAKSQAEADNSLQLTLYGAATQKPKAEYICLCKTKTPKTIRVSTDLTAQRAQWAAVVYAEVIRAISKGVFPPCDPANWCCSERFCGYWKLCRGKNM